MPEQKTAIVIGATGLVGVHLTQLLLNHPSYSKVTVFVRRQLKLSSNFSKLEQIRVDFDEIESWKHSIKGDELFSALGTTRRQAGGRQQQYKVDFEFQLSFAKAALENGVQSYSLVSSLGADAKSPIFYSRMKGQLEEEIRKLKFIRTAIFRPSVLTGDREEERPFETMGANIAGLAARMLPVLKKYRPIRGEEVAKAMLKTAQLYAAPGVKIYEGDEIFALL